ncbi:MAG: hypothetical protein E6J41_21930 [Chloroflexi bacterium]|nr:MAG: hypothetical protein E6J41_21930 [Chloroflexota bacterium]
MTVRLGVAAALLACLLVASAGLAWDIAWHTFIGRDSFLTPPHAVLYGGVAAAGIVALAGVLLESWRRRPGTASLLRVFHAPLGLFVTGFGILTLVVSALLDNYWHELYGIDVTLWAPFHVMGLIGGLVAVLGVVYVFAAELARRRRLAEGGQLALLALVLFSWSAALRGLLVIFEPAYGQSPTTTLGPLDVLTLPVGLAFSIALVGAGAAGVAGRRAMAAAGAGGYTFYTPAGPVVQRLDLLVPLGLLVPAAFLDGAHRLAGRGLAAGLVAAVPAAALGSWAVTQSRPVAAGAVALGVAAALLAGGAGGWLGAQLGTVWRLREG